MNSRLRESGLAFHSFFEQAVNNVGTNKPGTPCNECKHFFSFRPGFPFWHPEPQQYTPHRLVRNHNFTL